LLNFDPPLVVLGFLASRLIARLVEKKLNTSTVGGAHFVVILLTPAVVALSNFYLPDSPVHLLAILAAASISHALGERVGRLSCISFGCCYRKLLAECHPVMRKIFARWHFIFSGKTPKPFFSCYLRFTGDWRLPVRLHLLLT
jgi:hypothetical protein